MLNLYPWIRSIRDPYDFFNKSLYTLLNINGDTTLILFSLGLPHFTCITFNWQTQLHLKMWKSRDHDKSLVERALLWFLRTEKCWNHSLILLPRSGQRYILWVGHVTHCLVMRVLSEWVQRNPLHGNGLEKQRSSRSTLRTKRTEESIQNSNNTNPTIT